jgi:MFS family permease
MLPLTAGFLVAGPAAGWLSDHHGARPFATGGMVLAAASFGLLMLLPANFSFPAFAALLLMNGIGMGLFAAPNTTGIMNSVPAHQRGAASGMRATFQNTGMVLSVGLFFSLMIIGLSASLPTSMRDGLERDGVPAATAQRIADEPPVGSLFAAFLGYNPMEKLVGPQTLAQLPPDKAADITGTKFFPELISGPFIDGLRIAFSASLVMCLIAAAASWLRGGHYVADQHDTTNAFGAPPEARPNDDEAPIPDEWVPA